MALILDGKAVAAARKAALQAKIDLLASRGVQSGLAIVIVGDDAASRIYAERMAKVAAQMGLKVTVKQLPAATSQEELLQIINQLNDDSAIHGILPMMPLPAHLNADEIIAALDPAKDVDALSPISVGLVAAGKSKWAPCTPRAVMAILDHYNIELTGKHAVIIGRSNVVGKPLMHLLLSRNATVTVCHSKTQDLAAMVRQGDIVVAAVGKAELITADMIKPGAVVIDVGINEVGDRLTGDVDFTSVERVAAAITPVPGGVGSVTTTMVLDAALRELGHD